MATQIWRTWDVIMRTVKQFIRDVKQYIVQLDFALYDWADFTRHSSSRWDFGSQEKFRAYITATTHNIEKGLSLPNPRLGFGSDNLKSLTSCMKLYIERYGPDDVVARTQAVLSAYVAFNERNSNYEYPHKDEIHSIINTECSIEASGGLKTLDKSEWLRIVSEVGLSFFTSRSSVRNFSTEAVSISEVEFALAAARKSPSVCNRQSGFIHILTSRHDIDAALEMQGGARGFSHSVPMLLVVTTRTDNFWGTERNQRWIDGGLFGMSLILGFHAQGVATCCLNWSKTPRQDKTFKSKFRIPPNESIIFLLAVGRVEEKTNVVVSEKRPLGEMMRLA